MYERLETGWATSLLGFFGIGDDARTVGVVEEGGSHQGEEWVCKRREGRNRVDC